MATTSEAAEARPIASEATRWGQLIFGIICMVMIANRQYGWTLFVTPIDQKYHWGRAAIQVAFTIFVLTETWLVPIEGYLVDRFGPKVMVCGSGVLVAIAWAINSVASSLLLLYVGAAIGGIGAGVIYGASVGNALKWFPDRRGLAAGLTAAGFGAGSALTVIPIANMIQSSGYQSAVFWVMYAMFVMVGTGGLMATAQLAPIANDFKIANVPVSLLGLTLPALTFALSIDRVLNGLTRPFFGWVSDNIGRENTMFLAFAVESLGILALYKFGHDPILFVILTGMVFFAWGEIYSLFPSTCADTFGTKYAAANAGMLYTAKGTASLLVPLSSMLTAMTGNWHAVFIVASVMNAAAALLAWFVLKPMRRQQMEEASSAVSDDFAGEPA